MSGPHDPARDALPVAAELSVHAEVQPSEEGAEQGPPPADFASRPASLAPTPTGQEQSLSAEEVARLTGDEGAQDSRDLADAGRLDSGL